MVRITTGTKNDFMSINENLGWRKEQSGGLERKTFERNSFKSECVFLADNQNEVSLSLFWDKP